VFNSADFHAGADVVMKRWPGRPPRGTTHETDDFAGWLGLSCVLGASLEETLGEDSPLAIQIAANTSDRGAA